MSRSSTDDVVALIPAAGRARRLGELPCSKEVLPVGLVRHGDTVHPRLACHGLLERLAVAGIGRAFFVLRRGKWDVAHQLATGAGTGVALAYLCLADSASVPETLDGAYPFIADRRVALGWPDVLFEPADAYRRLLQCQAASGADLVLGLFPTDRPQQTDMVRADADGRVRAIEVRPTTSRLRYNWLLALWTPRFSRFLHRAMAGDVELPPARGERQLGEIFAAALDRLDVRAVSFPEGSFRDLGTPEELAAMWRESSL